MVIRDGEHFQRHLRRGCRRRGTQWSHRRVLSGWRGAFYSRAIVYPNALRELHIEFREAGAEVLQALTFYASRDKLATVRLEDRVEDINRSAVRVAKEVAGDQCLVARQPQSYVDV